MLNFTNLFTPHLNGHLSTILIRTFSLDYFYNITITTASTSQAKFDSQEGNLKIKLRGINMQAANGAQDFTLTSRWIVRFCLYKWWFLKFRCHEAHNWQRIFLFISPVTLRNEASWSFPIQTEIAFERLQAIELRWTLKSPFNPSEIW